MEALTSLFGTAALQTGAACIVAAVFVLIYAGVFRRGSGVTVPIPWMLWYLASGLSALAVCFGFFLLLDFWGIRLPMPLLALAEEALKFLALLVVFVRKPSAGSDDFDDPLYAASGALGGLVLGLGFGLLENILYSLGDWTTLMVRQASTVPLHGLTAAIVGRALGSREMRLSMPADASSEAGTPFGRDDIAETERQPLRAGGWPPVAGGLGVAIVAHIMYNTLLTLGNPWSLFSVVIVVALALRVYHGIRKDV